MIRLRSSGHMGRDISETSRTEALYWCYNVSVCIVIRVKTIFKAVHILHMGNNTV